MDAAELNNYPGGTMGESRRRRSWGSSSLTLLKAPSPRAGVGDDSPLRLLFQRRKGSPHSLYRYVVSLQTQTRGSNTQTHQLAIRSLGHVARAWLLGHPVLQAPPERAGTEAGRGGRGAQAVAPQVRPAVSPPRAASRRSPQPRARRARRPPGPWVHSSAGGWAAGALETANGGGGRRGGGAPIPTTFGWLALQAHLSPFLASGEEFLSRYPDPPINNSSETRAHREILRGSCLTPSSCFGGGRRSPQLPGLHLEPPGASVSRVEPAVGSGRGTGPRGTPPATSASHRTHRVLDARANNTVSRRRRRPPPAPSSFATLHNRTRRPAPEAGGNRWTLAT